MFLRVLENVYCISQMKFENIVLDIQGVLRCFDLLCALLTGKDSKPEEGFVRLKLPWYN